MTDLVLRNVWVAKQTWDEDVTIYFVAKSRSTVAAWVAKHCGSESVQIYQRAALVAGDHVVLVDVLPLGTQSDGEHKERWTERYAEIKKEERRAKAKARKKAKRRA